MFQDSYCASFLPRKIFFFFDSNYRDSFTKDAEFNSDLWKRFKDGLLHNVGDAHEDEMWNPDMKLDDILTEGITMMWKVDVDLLLFDITTLSLDDDRLRLRSKICTALGLMRKNEPFNGHGLDH